MFLCLSKVNLQNRTIVFQIINCNLKCNIKQFDFTLSHIAMNIVAYSFFLFGLHKFLAFK